MLVLILLFLFLVFEIRLIWIFILSCLIDWCLMILWLLLEYLIGKVFSMLRWMSVELLFRGTMFFSMFTVIMLDLFFEMISVILFGLWVNYVIILVINFVYILGVSILLWVFVYKCIVSVIFKVIIEWLWFFNFNLVILNVGVFLLRLFLCVVFVCVNVYFNYLCFFLCFYLWFLCFKLWGVYVSCVVIGGIKFV